MKKVFLSFLLCFCAYSFSVAQTVAKASLSNYEWLLGKWEQINYNSFHMTYEKWTKDSDTKFIGLGWVMNSEDTIFIEKMSLVIKENVIYYIADVGENDEPVSFKVIKQSKKSFVSSNPGHDFPKQIAYIKNAEDMMTAVISGNGREITYQFKKIAD